MKNQLIRANNIQEIVEAIGQVSLNHYRSETNKTEKAFYLGMLNVAIALGTIDEETKVGGIGFDYKTVKEEMDSYIASCEEKRAEKAPVVDNQISMQDYLPELFAKLDKLIKKIDKDEE